MLLCVRVCACLRVCVCLGGKLINSVIFYEGKDWVQGQILCPLNQQFVLNLGVKSICKEEKHAFMHKWVQ